MIEGKTFVFTGKLSITRNEAWDLVQAAGGDVSSHISKSTDFVVVGEKPGSKFNTARLLGLKLIDEEDFLKLLEGSSKKAMVASEPEAQKAFSPPPKEDLSYFSKGNLLDFLNRHKGSLLDALIVDHPCPYCGTIIPYTIDKVFWYCFNCQYYSNGAEIEGRVGHIHLFIESPDLPTTEGGKYLICRSCNSGEFFTNDELTRSEELVDLKNYCNSLEFSLEVNKTYPAVLDPTDTRGPADIVGSEELQVIWEAKTRARMERRQARISKKIPDAS